MVSSSFTKSVFGRQKGLRKAGEGHISLKKNNIFKKQGSEIRGDLRAYFVFICRFSVTFARLSNELSVFRLLFCPWYSA